MMTSGETTSLVDVHTQPLFGVLLAIPASLGFLSITSASPMCQTEFPHLGACSGRHRLEQLEHILSRKLGLISCCRYVKFKPVCKEILLEGSMVSFGHRPRTAGDS